MKKKDDKIVLFRTDDGKVSVDVRFDEETVWLSLDQIAALFERDKSTISRHIKSVYDDGELKIEATVAKFATVQVPLIWKTQERFTICGEAERVVVNFATTALSGS